ncbi:MAG TPA: zinc ABC transporter substrate-binding protein [Rhabdochlamydiaceae bacterium]|jgi:zinc transport system substrate-binding protein
MRVICFCLLFLCGAASCQKRPSQPAAKPIVLVSIPSYLYFIERIAGDTVTALSLTPPGANPHIYEPSPKEVQNFRQASLWIRLPSDRKTYAVLKEQSPKMCIVDITEGIPLLPAFAGRQAACHGHHCGHLHDAEEYDLHIWLSPRLAQKQAKTIAQHLAHLLPENRERYDLALSLFLEDLRKADAEISALLASKEESAILVSHPAFAYLCQDYRLTQLSIEIEGKEPLPQDITHLLHQAKQLRIASILAEPQYNDKGAQLMATHLHLPVYVVDPYAENYLENLKYIAEIMAKS